MALPRGLGKSQLQKHYGKKLKLKNFNLHHLVPSSCDGETNEFNLYPYRVKSHNAYNSIFLNMTIWQVWEWLGLVHETIFFSDKEGLNRYWLAVCKLKTDKELRVQVDKIYNVEYLQEKWINAFGGASLKQARRVLKHMMLFIIFGSRMADTEYLFDNGNLTEFFENYPADEDRLRSFNICFGESADWQTIKAKMAKILRQLP